MSLKNPVPHLDREVKGSPDGLFLVDALAEPQQFSSRQVEASSQKYVHWPNMLLKTAVEGSGQFLTYYAGVGEDHSTRNPKFSPLLLLRWSISPHSFTMTFWIRQRFAVVSLPCITNTDLVWQFCLETPCLHKLCALAAEYPTTVVCKEVAQATRAVCAGETRQVHLRGDINLEVGEYLHIIELKTAELFRVSCLLGSLVVDEDNFSRSQAMASFGRHLGRAYQIFDDAADFLGKEDKLGKTLGTDLASRKLTLPALLLRDQMGVDALLQFLDKLTGSSEAARDAVTAAMVQNNVFHEVEEYFLRELQAASKGLERANLNKFANTALCQLVSFLEGEFRRLITGY